MDQPENYAIAVNKEAGEWYALGLCVVGHATRVTL